MALPVRGAVVGDLLRAAVRERGHLGPALDPARQLVTVRAGGGAVRGWLARCAVVETSS